ncbi:mechanosensitive ion channel family protein [Anaerosporobacter faecicola]|uniref:mechanosensitive ion channel family protein n=1 Tax=Anaerosporobacter faecicola TaxID=2718714 RepID=UPI0014391AA7|nr:mechanosensitive ion channel domain-containing protein [Anaerosporobacter faecicola]
MSFNSVFLSTNATNTVKAAVEDGTKEVSRMAQYLSNAQDKIINFGIKLIIVLIIWFIGKKIIKGILHIFDRTFKRSSMEASVASFLIALIKAILYGILVVMLINTMGWDASSLVAVLGTATLSIGLALQGSLSNFAGGVLILIMKPFRVGDYIITPDREGTVTGLDIIYTRLLTNDNRLVVIPNGSLSNSTIINVTHEPVRRLDLSVSIDYSENIKKVKEILERVAGEHELVLKEHETSVFVNSFDPSAINIGIRVWVMTENYWVLKWDLLEKIKDAFDAADVSIPFDQLDVNITNRDLLTK